MEDNNFIYLYNLLQMKQSSRRSKDILKSIVSPSLDQKKPITNYQEYEQQLASYQQNNKHNNIANLFDWTKPSEIISLKNAQGKKQEDKKEEVIQNNSMNTEQLLRSDKDPKERNNEEYLDDSFQVQVPKAQPSFAQRIKNQYGNEYRDMTSGQIENELKAMRQKILQMNEKLNRLLDKYELLGVKHIKRQAQINNPYKLLCKEIQTNNKVIASQLQQIKQIQEKDKQLQKKDLLVQLNELIIEIGKQIHDTGKQKHSKWVDAERIDRLLKQIEDIKGTEQEYRQVKELKVKIVYYFKKLKSQKAQEQQYDLQIEKISQKNDQMAKQYQSYMQVAVQNSLQVSSNKKYLQLKKKYEELVVAVQTCKRNKQISIKFQSVAQQRLQRQKQSMKKQLQKVSLQTLQVQNKAIALDQQTNSIINTNHITNHSIKSISYRFDSSLLHTYKPNFKPDFKRAISKMQASRDSVNRTASNATDIQKRNNMRIANDKNIPIDQYSSNAQHSDLTESKLKPILRQWKGKSQRSRYAQSPTQNRYKTVQVSNIFKPPLLVKSKKNNG